MLLSCAERLDICLIFTQLLADDKHYKCRRGTYVYRRSILRACHGVLPSPHPADPLLPGRAILGVRRPGSFGEVIVPPYTSVRLWRNTPAKGKISKKQHGASLFASS